MGTTRIKVIDLSSDQKEIKTSRKHAEKLTGIGKLKEKKTKKPTTSPHSDSVALQPQSAENNLTAESKALEDSTIAKIPAADKITEEKNIAQAEPSKAAAKKHLHHKGSKYQTAKQLIENKDYSVKEALTILPKTSTVKFDPAVEVHLNVADKNVKAQVKFPHATSTKKQEKRYLVFNDKQLTINDKQIIWGDEKTIVEIETGKLKPGRDFEIVLSSPKFMTALAKIAKILGPKGLMPNPKNGTIVDDPQKYFGQAESDISQIRTDPTAAIIHAKIGKLSQGEKELQDNLKALILAIGPAKIQKTFITTTMGPSIKLDLTTI